MDWFFRKSQSLKSMRNNDYLKQMILKVHKHMNEDLNFLELRDRVVQFVLFDVVNVLSEMEDSGAINISDRTRVVKLIDQDRFTPKSDAAKFLSKRIFDLIDGRKTAHDIEVEIKVGSRVSDPIWGEVGDEINQLIKDGDLDEDIIDEGSVRYGKVLKPASFHSAKSSFSSGKFSVPLARISSPMRKVSSPMGRVISPRHHKSPRPRTPRPRSMKQMGGRRRSRKASRRSSRRSSRRRLSRRRSSRRRSSRRRSSRRRSSRRRSSRRSRRRVRR